MSRTDIDALNATLIQGLEKHDAAMMASVYAPGAQLLPPGEPEQTGPGIEQYWKAAIDMGVDGGALQTQLFEERGDLAVEEGRYEIRAGGDVIDDGKYVVVHRRQPDGSWKYGIDIWNSSRPAPTA